MEANTTEEQEKRAEIRAILSFRDRSSATMEEMNRYLTREGFVLDFTEERRHHEIYLSDARRIAPQRRRTVIRDPIKKIQE